MPRQPQEKHDWRRSTRETGAEERHAEAVELVRDKLALADAWARYLAAQNRPDSGESHPNKHVRLLRLVFRILGPREKIATNPFDDISSKHEVQTHRQELSWDVLCRVCDAATGEMKRLLFLGIYTGQRLADCCLLTWDQVDLMRGSILINPRKTARRTGKPLHIPIHPARRGMLETIPPEQRTGFVLPELAAHYQANRDRATDRVSEHGIRGTPCPYCPWALSWRRSSAGKAASRERGKIALRRLA